MWSGWVFSFLGLVATTASLRIAIQERARSKALTTTLSRVSFPATPGAPSTPPHPDEEQLRALLIQAAARKRTLGETIFRAAKRGVDESELRHVAKELAGRGLLRFEGPLVDNTTLSLNV